MGQTLVETGVCASPETSDLWDAVVGDFRFKEDPISANLSDFFFVKLGSSLLLLRSCKENVLDSEVGKSEKLRDDGVIGSGLEWPGRSTELSIESNVTPGLAIDPFRLPSEPRELFAGASGIAGSKGCANALWPPVFHSGTRVDVEAARRCVERLRSAAA